MVKYDIHCIQIQATLKAMGEKELLETFKDMKRKVGKLPRCLRPGTIAFGQDGKRDCYYNERSECIHCGGGIPF